MKKIVFINGQEPALNDANLNQLQSNIEEASNFTGFVQMFAGTTAPTGWLMCDGSQYLKTEYPELFSVIGTAYNLSTDTGETHFRVPDLRERVAVGSNGDGEFALGNSGGEKEHTLIVDEMPEHNHTLSHSNLYHYAYSQEEEKTVNFSGSEGRPYASVSINNAGGSKPHNNMQPYVVLNYIIKA